MIAAMVLCVEPLLHATPLSDAGVDAYNARMAVQNIGPKYKFTSDNVLLEGAKVVRDMGSNTYKFTMTPSAGSYGISISPGITSLNLLARDEPTYRAMFDLDGIRNYVFWCYTFANPHNWNWNNGFTATEQAAEYNEIYALAVHFLTLYNGTGKNFYIGHWEGDWSLGVDSSNAENSNPTPVAIQGMIDWLNIRQKAVDDAMANTPHSNVNVYCYTEVNRVRDACEGNMDRVINRVVPNVPNLDYVSWSSYEIQSMSKPEIKAYLDYAESFLPTAKAGKIPGKRIFIGEFGMGSLTEAEQAPLIAAYEQTLFEWGCPFALYWTLYDNDLNDGAAFDLIDQSGTKTANYWLHHHYLNTAKLQLLEFKQLNGRLPTDTEFSTMASSILDAPLAPPVPLTVRNQPAAITSQQSANLTGSLLQGIYGDECARMYLYWGTADGGTVRDNWQHVVDLGVNTQAGMAAFSCSLAGLTPNTTYHYRFFASNNNASAWADATGSFQTMDIHVFTPLTPGTYNWNDVGNWNSGGVPVGGTTTGVTVFQDTGTPVGNGTITIQGDPSNLTINTLGLNGLGPGAGGSGLVNVGTAGNTWTIDGNNPIIFLNGRKTAQSLNFTVNPNLQLAGNTVFHGDGNATFTFSGAITGTKSLIKSGTSSLTLSGTGSNYSGGLYIKEGTVNCNTVSAFGSGTVYLGDTSGRANATLCGFSSSSTTSAPIVVQAGSTGNLTIRNPSYGSTNFLGNLTLNHDVTLDGGTTNSAFSIFKTGILSGTGDIIVKNTGNGATVVLQHAGSGSYTGTVTAQNGILRLANTSALNSANEVRVNRGATLDIRSNATIAGLNDGAESGGSVINNGSATTRTLTLAGSGSYDFTGSISDGSSTGRIMALTKSGSGIQALGGSSTYSGGTAVDGGVLKLRGATAAGSGPVSLGGATEQLLLCASTTFPNTILISGGTGTSGRGLIDTDNGGKATLSAATITITASPAVGNSGHFGSDTNGSLTVRGYIQSTVTVDWRRNNGIFSGGGNYTNFRIRSGTVKLGDHNGLATSATLDLGANSGGGTFDLAGYNQTLVGITKAANPATITNSGNTVSTLTITGTSNFAGSLADGNSPLALNITGGTLTLAGTNSHTGGTTISGGTLVLATAESLPGNSALLIAAGAKLDTTAVPSFKLPASRAVTFGINPAGSGSAGQISATGLDIAGAVVDFQVAGPLDDPAYVLANYTGRTGATFAAVTPPAGYTIDYNYASGTKIALVRHTGTNANLRSLGLSDGTLSPAFSSSITEYSATVPNTTTSLAITALAEDELAMVKINGVAAVPGNPVIMANLSVGANPITAVVTSQDGTASRTYTIIVTRLASTNASLAGLSLGSGTLSPPFASGTGSYTAMVSSTTSSLFITPTVADSTASVAVNGVAAISGSPCGPFTLSYGSNVITIVVTAQDGIATQTYMVTVTRATTAATYTFNQFSAGTHAWTSGGNWDANGIPASAESVAIAFFPDTATALENNTYTIASDPAAFTLNTLTLNGLGAAGTSSSALVNIGTSKNVWTFGGANPTVNLNALKNTSKDLVYNIKPDLVLTKDVTFAGNGTAGTLFNGFAFSGSISGPGGLTKGGTSRLTLSGSNSYSGGTVFNGGQLWIGGDSLGTGAVTINGTAKQLVAVTNARLGNSITLAAGTGAGTSTQGLIDAGNNVFVLDGPIHIGATPQSGGHFGSNTGTLVIQGAVTATVPVVVRRGTVVFGGGGSSFGNLTVSSGTAKLGTNNGLPTSATVDLGVVSGGAAFDLAGYNQTLAGITKNANAAVITNSGPGDATLSITGTSRFDGVIQDGATYKTALTVQGGSLTLGAANTYRGATTIHSGSLILDAAGSIANSSSIHIAAGAVWNSSSKPVLMLASGQPVTIGLDGGGAGSSGKITADGLDISQAWINFEITGDLDDPVYVIAKYNNRTGTAFASVTPPDGYVIDYAHASGTEIALVASRFHLWRQAHFPGSTSTSGPGADLATPAGDGIPNLLKFSLGMDPHVASRNPCLHAISGNAIHFTYTPGAEAVADGMVFTVEYNDDLTPQGWRTDLVNQGVIGTGGVPVTATIPMNGSARRFVRLKTTTAQRP